MEVKDLQHLCEQMFKMQAVIDEMGKAKTQKQKELDSLKATVSEFLGDHEMKGFDAGETIGKVGSSEKRSVSLLDRYAFFEWYKENINENLEESFSISAATITKIYNEAFDRAKVAGEVDFLTDGIPGLSEPKVFRTIKMYRPKKGAK